MNIWGLITFTNILLVLAVCMIVGSIIFLFGHYIVNIIKFMPLQFIEIILYFGLSLLICKSPELFGSELAFIWGFLFAFCLTGTTLITGVRSQIGDLHWFNFVNTIIHGIVGTYLKSTLICATSVMFFMFLIGFQFRFGQGYLSFGFGKKDVIPTAALTSGITTCMGIIVKINISSTHLTPGSIYLMEKAKYFIPGMLWFGPFVYFLSLLILSSELYSTKESYVPNNMITIITSVFAVLIGNLYDIDQLTGISGTFFCIFILEKYFEIIPKHCVMIAWTMLFFGTIIYMYLVHFRMEIEKYGLEEYFHLVPTIYNVTT
jgi:hypothetical protein